MWIPVTFNYNSTTHNNLCTYKRKNQWIIHEMKMIFNTRAETAANMCKKYVSYCTHCINTLHCKCTFVCSTTDLIRQTINLECNHFSFWHSTNKKTISTSSSNWVLFDEATKHQYSVSINKKIQKSDIIITSTLKRPDFIHVGNVFSEKCIKMSSNSTREVRLLSKVSKLPTNITMVTIFEF